MPRPRTISNERLLRVARERFLRDGVGASTRRIAADAKVSEGILFQRFGSKEDLFFACMRLPPPELEPALERALAAASPATGLLGLASAALGYLRDWMPLVLLVAAHPASRRRLRPGADQARALLGEASTLRAVFERFFEARARPDRAEGRDFAPQVDLLVSTLLSRALHEQIGFADPDEAGPWLEATLAALDEGVGLAPR